MTIARAKSIIPSIDNWEQHDAHETLLLFLEQLEEEAKRWREQSGTQTTKPLSPTQ